MYEVKIKAFLHDPPDKAIKIAQHKERAKKLIEAAGIEAGNMEEVEECDHISSSLERIVPERTYIDFSQKTIPPILKHPIIRGERKLFKALMKKISDKGVDNFLRDIFEVEVEVVRELIQDAQDEDWRGKFLLLWRYMKERLKEKLREKGLERELCEELVNLPADTRCPDHTIWDHLDVTSAICGALKKGKKLALLGFKISPVQAFIRNARKEKDLWAGSHLLSYLTFQAIKVVIGDKDEDEGYGPDSIIFPYLKGQPLVDRAYFKSTSRKLSIACLPNRFLAIVNYEKAEELERKIRERVAETIEELLKGAMKWAFSESCQEIDFERELEKAKSYFKVTIFTIPADLDGIESEIEKLPKGMREKYKKWKRILEATRKEKRCLDYYSLMFELLEAVIGIESRKFEKPMGERKEKCHMCGELEIFGSKEMWEKVTLKNFKENERLCPICLIKRYYPKYFSEEYEIEVGFESVSEVALRRRVEKGNGKKTYLEILKSKLGDFMKELKELRGLPENWEVSYPENLRNLKAFSHTLGVNEEMLGPEIEEKLEEARKEVERIENEYGRLPRYYALVVIDGDRMGKMLAGEDMGPIKDYLHEHVFEAIQQKQLREPVEKTENQLKDLVEKTKRLMTPAKHSAISRALAHFSINIVPKIVRESKGELIYSGGDDIFALLPTDTALKCAYKIQKRFQQKWDGWDPMPSRTMSAGLLIVHYKHPLYDAVERVRNLEKKAKGLGRNCIVIGYLKRNGSYYETSFGWSLLEEEKLKKLRRLYTLIKLEKEGEAKESISKRFIYHVLNGIEKIPEKEEKIRSFLKYELKRHMHGVERKEESAEELSEWIITLAKEFRVHQPKKCSLHSKEQHRTGTLVEKVKRLFILLKIMVECDFDLGDWDEGDTGAQ